MKHHVILVQKLITQNVTSDKIHVLVHCYGHKLAYNVYRDKFKEQVKYIKRVISRNKRKEILKSNLIV